MSSHGRRDEQEGHARPPVPDIMAILGENKPRRRFPWGWLALVIVLIAAGYGGYRFYQSGDLLRQHILEGL